MGDPEGARVDGGTADDWNGRRRRRAQHHRGRLRGRAGRGAAAAHPGLPDEAFRHDGQLTKREVRAATLAALAPVPGQRLWDVGAGCGSIAIEWMRAAPRPRPSPSSAAGPPRPDRRERRGARRAASSPSSKARRRRRWPGSRRPTPSSSAAAPRRRVSSRPAGGAAARRPPGRQRRHPGGRGRRCCRLARGGRRRADPHRGLARRAGRRVPRLAAADAGHPVRGGEAMTGTLYGLGIGPGDPELITLKALRVLQAAPVLAYPAPEAGDSLARASSRRIWTAARKRSPSACRSTDASFPAQGRHLRRRRRPSSAGTWRPAATSPCSARATPSSTAPSCTSSAAWPSASGRGGARRLLADRLRRRAGRAAGGAQRRADRGPGAPRRRGAAARPLDQVEAAAIIKVGRHLPQGARPCSSELGLLASARYIEHATMGSQKILPPLAVDCRDAAPYFSMILVHRPRRGLVGERAGPRRADRRGCPSPERLQRGVAGRRGPRPARPRPTARTSSFDDTLAAPARACSPSRPADRRPLRRRDPDARAGAAAGRQAGEPPVLALAEDGGAVVPLLGGHRGANALARGRSPGNSASRRRSPPPATCASASPWTTRRPGWRLGNPEHHKAFAARAAGRRRGRRGPRLEGEAAWLDRRASVCRVDAAALICRSG